MASMVEFQSTHPCGVRRQFVNGMDLGLGVSIHAPLRGATGPSVLAMSSHAFQSTHPCGVRPERFIHRIVQRKVSIHAPLRGATAKQAGFEPEPAVSIHAPLRGATLSAIMT